MPRKIRVGDVKTKLLDYILILFSLVAIVGGLGFMIFIVVYFPEFHIVPFIEFLVLFCLGILGFRSWRKEITA
jgi:hypothetical protein